MRPALLPLHAAPQSLHRWPAHRPQPSLQLAWGAQQCLKGTMRQTPACQWPQSAFSADVGPNPAHHGCATAVCQHASTYSPPEGCWLLGEACRAGASGSLGCLHFLPRALCPGTVLLGLRLCYAVQQVLQEPRLLCIRRGALSKPEMTQQATCGATMKQQYSS